MIVLQLNACPPGIRGDVTKWLMEISTGVYVGKLSQRVREALWDRLCRNLGTGSAVMVYSAKNEQGFEFRVHNTAWQPVEFDGITLMRRPYSASNNRSKPGFSETDAALQPDVIPQDMVISDFAEYEGHMMPQQAYKAGDRFQTNTLISTDSRSTQVVPTDISSASAILDKPHNISKPDADMERRTQTARPPRHDSSRRRRNVTLPYVPWPEGMPFPLSFTVLDMETTGLEPETDAMIEVACVRVREGAVSDEMHCLVQCDRPLPEIIHTMTGLTDVDLAQKGVPLKEAVNNTLDFLGDDWIVGHNIAFDICFLLSACRGLGIVSPQMHAIDTVSLARRILTGSVPGFKLETLAQYLQIADKQSHRALPDARLTAKLYLKLNEIAITAK